MSKFYRVTVIFMIFGLIALSVSSCGIFSSLNSDESESESDINPADTESDIKTETQPIEVTEPAEITQEPEPEPQNNNVGKNFSASGTIKSDTKQLLKLRIDWKAYQTSESEYADLEMTVYLDCYAIMVGARTNSTLTVDGEKIEFSTPMITNEQNSLTSVELHKESMKILNTMSEEKQSVEVSAGFYFGGSYGGEAIGWVEVSGVVYLTDDGSPIPEQTEKDPLVPELPEDPFKPVEG